MRVLAYLAKEGVYAKSMDDAKKICQFVVGTTNIFCEFLIQQNFQ